MRETVGDNIARYRQYPRIVGETQEGFHHRIRLQMPGHSP